MHWILIGIATSVIYALAQVQTGVERVDCENTYDTWECRADRVGEE
jgi:hypothetical protein